MKINPLTTKITTLPNRIKPIKKENPIVTHQTSDISPKDADKAIKARNLSASNDIRHYKCVTEEGAIVIMHLKHGKVFKKDIYAPNSPKISVTIEGKDLEHPSMIDKVTFYNTDEKVAKQYINMNPITGEIEEVKYFNEFNRIYQHQIGVNQNTGETKAIYNLYLDGSYQSIFLKTNENKGTTEQRVFYHEDGKTVREIHEGIKKNDDDSETIDSLITFNVKTGAPTTHSENVTISDDSISSEWLSVFDEDGKTVKTIYENYYLERQNGYLEFDNRTEYSLKDNKLMKTTSSYDPNLGTAVENTSPATLN